MASSGNKKHCRIMNRPITHADISIQRVRLEVDLYDLGGEKIHSMNMWIQKSILDDWKKLGAVLNDSIQGDKMELGIPNSVTAAIVPIDTAEILTSRWPEKGGRCLEMEANMILCGPDSAIFDEDCFCCGDACVDADLTEDFYGRDANCILCHPCFLCENCSLSYKGKAYCLSCIYNDPTSPDISIFKPTLGQLRRFELINSCMFDEPDDLEVKLPSSVSKAGYACTGGCEGAVANSSSVTETPAGFCLSV